MSEHIRLNRLDSDHLIGLIKHGEKMIELWQARIDTAMGVLACREAMLEYPEYEGDDAC